MWLYSVYAVTVQNIYLQNVLSEYSLHLLLWLIFRQSHPNFHQCTHRVHLRNLGTTDKKYSHKIRHRKIPGEHQIQQEEIGQWDIFIL